MPSIIARLLREDDGQDLIEYALLTSVIGLVSVATFPVILNAIGTVYGTWETSMNTLWEPSNPIGSGS